MNVAICYYGMLGAKTGHGGIGKVIPPEECFNSIRKHIIDKNNNVDIFIHSWSVNERDQIIETIKPRKYIFEQVKEFPNAIRHKEPVRNLKELRFLISRKLRGHLYPEIEVARQAAVARSYSRWYSTKKSIELKAQYEEEIGSTYDYVMLLRFDVEFYTDLVFSNYSNDKFYAANWNDLPRSKNGYQLQFNQNYLGSGFLDLWFFSGSKEMDKFGQLYDNIENYNSSPHFASYEHACSYIGKEKIRYTLYRWQDFEMIRAKKYGVLPPGRAVRTGYLLQRKFKELLIRD